MMTMHQHPTPGLSSLPATKGVSSDTGTVVRERSR